MTPERKLLARWLRIYQAAQRCPRCCVQLDDCHRPQMEKLLAESVEFFKPPEKALN